MKKQEVNAGVVRCKPSGGRRYGVQVNGKLVAGNLTARKAKRRANGISYGIMNYTGRCLTRKERGLPKKDS